jgi:hypothetical protein
MTHEEATALAERIHSAVEFGGLEGAAQGGRLILAAIKDERAACLTIAVEVREQPFPAISAASETEVPRAALIRGCAQEIINRIEERGAL